MGPPSLLFLFSSSVINALNQLEERAVPAVNPSQGARCSGGLNEEAPSVSEQGQKSAKRVTRRRKHRGVLRAKYSRGSFLCVHLVRSARTGGVSKCDILGAVIMTLVT